MPSRLYSPWVSVRSLSRARVQIMALPFLCKLGGPWLLCLALVLLWMAWGVPALWTNPAHAAATAAHYLSSIISNGKVVHWNLKKMPLKIYLAAPPKTMKLTPLEASAMVYKATSAWAAASKGKLQFTSVASPNKADIVVCWVDHFEHGIIGVTPFKSLGNVIYQTDVQIGMKDDEGELLPAQVLYETVLHEFGHALGFQGHSPDAHDIMYWQVSPLQTGRLTARDTNTLNALYSLTADVTNQHGSLAQTREALAAGLLAQKALKAKQYQSAYNQSVAGLKKFPKDALLLVTLGAASWQLGQHQEAAKAFSLCLKADPKNVEARFRLGLIFVNEGQQRTQKNVLDAQTLAYFEAGIAQLQQVQESPDAPPQAGSYLRQAQSMAEQVRQHLQRTGS